MRWPWSSRTIYTCGNCRETFKTEADLNAHCTPVCPIVAIEREMAEYTRKVLERTRRA